MPSNRPLIFVDLDDTLFQTSRKMGEEVRYPASFDLDGKPSGYMNSVQKQFIEWVLNTADVVPVTARSVEAYRRVKLNFCQGAICSHGGVILSADNEIDLSWHSLMAMQLAHMQDRLGALCAAALDIGGQMGISLRGWVVEELGTKHYVVIKHNGKTDSVLDAVLSELTKREVLTDDLYVHSNGNNLAIMPCPLRKRSAVQEWIARDVQINGERPRIGFGDSISDLGFLSECHWWATPRKGQLAARVSDIFYHE